MPKKKKEDEIETSFEKIKDFLASGFFALLKDFFTDVVLIKVEHWLKHIAEHLRKSIYMAVSLIFAILFIFISIIFLLKDYLGVPYGFSFLVFGLAFLLISFAFHISIKGDE